MGIDEKAKDYKGKIRKIGVYYSKSTGRVSFLEGSNIDKEYKALSSELSFVCDDLMVKHYRDIGLGLYFAQNDLEKLTISDVDRFVEKTDSSLS